MNAFRLLRKPFNELTTDIFQVLRKIVTLLATRKAAEKCGSICIQVIRHLVFKALCVKVNRNSDFQLQKHSALSDELQTN